MPLCAPHIGLLTSWPKPDLHSPIQGQKGQGKNIQGRLFYWVAIKTILLGNHHDGFLWPIRWHLLHRDDSSMTTWLDLVDQLESGPHMFLLPLKKKPNIYFGGILWPLQKCQSENLFFDKRIVCGMYMFFVLKHIYFYSYFVFI